MADSYPLRLRPGRRALRTLYLVTGDGEDVLVGLVDSPRLAQLICLAVNSRDWAIGEESEDGIGVNADAAAGQSKDHR